MNIQKGKNKSSLTREELLDYIKEELKNESLEYLITEANQSLIAFASTKEYENLVDLYFSSICLLLKVTEFDLDIINMIFEDINYLEFNLN